MLLVRRRCRLLAGAWGSDGLVVNVEVTEPVYIVQVQTGGRDIAVVSIDNVAAGFVDDDGVLAECFQLLEKIMKLGELILGLEAAFVDDLSQSVILLPENAAEANEHFEGKFSDAVIGGFHGEVVLQVDVSIVGVHVEFDIPAVAVDLGTGTQHLQFFLLGDFVYHTENAYGHIVVIIARDKAYQNAGTARDAVTGCNTAGTVGLFDVVLDVLFVKGLGNKNS